MATKQSSDSPNLFRINVEVGNLDQAAAAYESLLGVPGHKQAGSRAYFACGGVTIQMVDVTAFGQKPHPAAKALYFSVRELEPVFDRAKALGWLSSESIHGTPGGAIVVRPWGERSFYANDPWGNPLCFVDEGTVYAG